MAHLRPRAIQSEIEKQLKFWPILTVFGPRQAGKSTLLRELLFDPVRLTYVNLERIQAREAARSNPERLLAQFEQEPIIIDEIKAMVDEDRRPGRFILTGSVQFSKKLGIRESFTGRAASVRMDSMTLSETSPQKNGLKEIQRYLQHGGMPDVCFLRDSEQVRRYWDEWIETTCYRDLLEISKGRLNSDIAFRVLELTATLERPTAAEMANKLRTDARRIQNHLEGLLSLFLIRKWEPVDEGVGKCMYLPFDCGLASHFGANLSRLWQVWFAHARVNAARQAGKKDYPLGFFLTPRGSFADFIDSKVVHVFNEEASVQSRLLLRLRALEKNFPAHRIVVYSATDQSAQKISDRVISVPWCEERVQGRSQFSSQFQHLAN